MCACTHTYTYTDCSRNWVLTLVFILICTQSCQNLMMYVQQFVHITMRTTSFLGLHFAHLLILLSLHTCFVHTGVLFHSYRLLSTFLFHVQKVLPKLMTAMPRGRDASTLKQICINVIARNFERLWAQHFDIQFGDIPRLLHVIGPFDDLRK